MSNKKKLFKAIESNKYYKVKEILTANQELVNAANKDGEIPLQIAVKKGYLDVVKLLIERGANVNTKDAWDSTPLHEAVSEMRLDIVRFLIENGAGVNTQDILGITPLHEAAQEGHTNVAEFLIESGADINAKDRDGKTPLHEAAQEGHTNVAELLIKKGADVNAKDKDGNTPLYYAVEGNEISIIALIVKNIAQREAVGLRVDEQNLQLSNQSINYQQNLQKCKEEIEKITRENKSLVDFLQAENLEESRKIWVENESVRNALGDENLKERYPEYADMLIHKANEVKKKILLDKNKPLIDALSGYYGCDFNSMTFNRIEAFLRKHENDNIVDIFPIVGLPPNLNRSLGRFIKLDVKEKRLLSLEGHALAILIGESQKVNTPLTNVNTKNVKEKQKSCCNIL